MRRRIERDEPRLRDHVPLRSLGLKDAIVYGDAGWTIPTSVRVVRARRAEGVA